MAVVINGTTGISGVSTVNLANGSVTQNILANGVAGTGPAFLASINGNASATALTWTKATLNTEVFDTNNCFDNTTNYRFTPNVAGYYQISCLNQQLASGNTYVGIYKNGSLYFQFGASAAGFTGSMLVYCNGSSDYIEMFIYSTNSTGTVTCTGNFVSMSGFLARAA